MALINKKKFHIYCKRAIKVFGLVIQVHFSRTSNIFLVFLLTRELPLALCAYHYINYIFKLLCTPLQWLSLFVMLIFRKQTFQRLQL